MRWLTEWWGLQFLAETDEEKDLLLTLKHSLPDITKNFYAYEAGTVEVIEHKSDNDRGFSSEEITNAKLVLEITR